MKRLNPETGKPFVRGDTRADGFLFLQYETTYIKKDGYFLEKWCLIDQILKKNENSKRWNKNNNEKVRLADNNWKKRNKQSLDKYKAAWSKNNLDKRAATSAKRRSAKLKRTPPWLTQEHLQQIESIYALAKQLTIDTGIEHHVDHIVPLQGKFVSGLHVPWNLRAIPATENCSKSNCFDVE